MAIQIKKFNIDDQIKKLEEVYKINEPYMEIFDTYKENIHKQQKIIADLSKKGYNQIPQKELVIKAQKSKHLKQSYDSMRTQSQIIKKQATFDDSQSNTSLAGILTDFNQKQPGLFDNQQILNEEQNAILMQRMEKIEHRNTILEGQLQDRENKNKELQKLVLKLQEELRNTEDFLVAQKIENAELKEIVDNNSLIILNLNRDKEKMASQVVEAEKEKNFLMERYLKEKETFADKLNELNEMEENLKQKQRIQQENEQYFKIRKEESIKEMQESGIKLKESAPNLNMALNMGYIPKKCAHKILKHHQSEIYEIAQNLNGTCVATCSGDRLIKFYDPLNSVTTSQIESYKSEQIFISVAFAPFSDIILAGTTDKEAQIWNYTNSKPMHTLLGHGNKVDTVSFCCEKDKCITGSSDRTIRIWDVNKGVQLKSISTSAGCKTIQATVSEPVLFSGHNDGSIKMYSIRDPKAPIHQYKNLYESAVTSMKVSDDGLYLLSSSQDGYYLKTIDLRKNQILNTYDSNDYYNSHEYNKACFGPSGQFVIGPSSSGEIVFWNTDSTHQKHKISNTGHEGVLISCAFHNVTGQLFTADSRGNFMIWV